MINFLFRQAFCNIILTVGAADRNRMFQRAEKEKRGRQESRPVAVTRFIFQFPGSLVHGYFKGKRMSLLAELLSKVKGTLGDKKDVPPALKDLIPPKREKKISSGLFAFIGLLTICSIAAGFWFVYFVHEKTGKTPGQDVSPLHESARTVTPQQEEHQPVPLVKTAAQENVPAPVPAEKSGRQTEAENMSSGAARIAASSPASGTVPSGSPAEAADEVSDTASPVSTPQSAGAIPSVQESMQAQAQAPVNRGQASRGQAGSSDLNELNNDEASSCIYSAMQFEEQRKYPEALAEYRKALKYRPNSPFILNNISYFYLRMGVYETALQDAKKALALNSDYIPAIVNAGISLAALNRNDEAERLLKRAVASEPYNRNALYNLGLLYEKEARFEEALTLYQNLVNTGDTDAYIHMARVLEQSGRREEAIGVYSGIISSTLVSGPVKKDAEQRLGRLR